MGGGRRGLGKDAAWYFKAFCNQLSKKEKEVEWKGWTERDRIRDGRKR